MIPWSHVKSTESKSLKLQFAFGKSTKINSDIRTIYVPYLATNIVIIELCYSKTRTKDSIKRQKTRILFPTMIK
jgi:hypothetical protein